MTFNPSKNSNSKIPKTEGNDFKRGTGKSDVMKLYQDPTVLGFKLFFMNIADSSQKDSTIDNTYTVNSDGLFGNVSNHNSALYYLKTIGDTARYNMLLDFKSLLSKLNVEYPWYFQSIEGLNEAWNRDYKVARIKKELTISCLESVDLRITALMDLYRKIAYDWQHRRAILPDNLRQFELTIKVYDIRNFQKDPGKYVSNPNDITNDKYQMNQEFFGSDYTETNQITFNFSHCEFMPNESGNMLSSVSNSTYEQATQSIKLSYENVTEDNVYRTLVALSKNNTRHYYVRDYLRKELSYLEGTNINQPDIVVDESDIDKLSDRVKKELGSLADDIDANVSAAAANLIKSRLSSLYLGNVYGDSASTTIGTARDTITKAPAKKIVNLGNAFGKDKK
tara:strand:+ start:4987 stop:6168 length:1182 start_codon:yes stop_codon:yes gene_type:complete